MIAMFRVLFSVSLVFIVLFGSVGLVLAQEEASPRITSPGAGQAIQGLATIQGSSEVPGFQSAEVSFAYAENPTNTWFSLARSQEQVNNGTLAAWDTSTITDGTYTLRLQVYLTDGKVLTTQVTGLRVRNYTPIETATPTPAPTVPTAVVSPTPVPFTPTPPPTAIVFTPTPFAPNPAEVTTLDIGLSVVRGVLISIVLFLGMGLYASIRRLFH